MHSQLRSGPGFGLPDGTFERLVFVKVEAGLWVGRELLGGCVLIRVRCDGLLVGERLERVGIGRIFVVEKPAERLRSRTSCRWSQF
jgi:hypothetical protein